MLPPRSTHISTGVQVQSTSTRYSLEMYTLIQKYKSIVIKTYYNIMQKAPFPFPTKFENISYCYFGGENEM